jgi:hypothetical protein
MKENTESILDTSRDIGLEINIEAKYMIMSHHPNSGQNENESFENVAKFKYLGRH